MRKKECGDGKQRFQNSEGKDGKETGQRAPERKNGKAREGKEVGMEKRTRKNWQVEEIGELILLIFLTSPEQDPEMSLHFGEGPRRTSGLVSCPHVF